MEVYNDAWCIYEGNGTVVGGIKKQEKYGSVAHDETVARPWIATKFTFIAT
jgi:hypothetical protein